MSSRTSGNPVTSWYRVVAGSGTASRLSSNAATVSRRSHCAATSGWISPIHPASSPATTIARRPARVQERLGRRLEAPVGFERVHQPLEHPLGREEVDRGRVAVAPARRAHGAGQQRADVVGLARELRRGAPVGQVDGAGLEQAQRAGAASAVVAGHVEQRAEQRRAEQRHVGRDRVLEPQRVPALVVVGEPEPVREVRVGEAPPDDLVQALGREHVGGAPAQPLARGQPARRAVARGQRGGKLLEPVEPRDLLDQVGLARDVAAPERGHGHVEAVVRLGGRELERVQDLHASRARDLGAEQARDPGVAQADRLRRRSVAADVDRARARVARRTARSSDGSRPPAPPSPARAGAASRTCARGFAAQPELQRRAVDVRSDPVRRLHQHARRVRADLRARAAHHAGDRRRAGGRPRSGPCPSRACASGRRASRSAPRRAPAGR